MSTNQQNKQTFSETIHEVVDSLVEKGETAVEKVKEWAGMEITDDIDHIKKKATRMNADQVHLKDEMQHELKTTHKEEKPIAVKEEYKEQREVIDNAQILNQGQAERKEEMQKELTNEHKPIPAFDEKTTIDKVKEQFNKTSMNEAMDKVKEQFDRASMNEAMDKVKEVWDTTTSKLTEKTGEVVDKVKEITGMENTRDAEYMKGKATKMNPEQAGMKQTMQRELLQQQEQEQPIEMPKGQEKEIQKQRKQQMQKELKKENKEIPAFDAKTSAVDKAKDFLETTGNTISEKSGSAVEKVKEWTGMKESKETVQQMKDKAVDKNPEQAKMQKELVEQNKKESPSAIKKEPFSKDQKVAIGSDDKSKEPLVSGKEMKFASEKEKKAYEEQIKASEKSNPRNKQRRYSVY